MPVDPNAAIEISAFAWVPPLRKGWCGTCASAGRSRKPGLHLPGAAAGRDERTPRDYYREQPFGQVPIYKEGDILLFETGAIVLHIAERSPALMSSDPAGRARTDVAG
jgi:glutathione S-transferase